MPRPPVTQTVVELPPALKNQVTSRAASEGSTLRVELIAALTLWLEFNAALDATVSPRRDAARRLAAANIRTRPHRDKERSTT